MSYKACYPHRPAPTTTQKPRSRLSSWRVSLFIRSIAVVTVVLAMGVMAVSAYAAKTDVVEEPAASLQSDVQPLLTEGGSLAVLTPDGETSTEGVLLSSISIGGKTDAILPGLLEDEPPQEELPVIYFAAPLEAGEVSIGSTGRNNLSLGPRVWRVLSIKPAGTSSRLGEVQLDIPGDQLVVMQQVSITTGIPWQVFAAIAKVESDFGQNMVTSPAGAVGYGQFLPDSWAVYGEGGDPYDFHDAIPAMGRLLLAAGALDDMEEAIYAYNDSDSYVTRVLSYAATYGYATVSEQGLIWPVTGVITTYFVPGDHLGIDIAPVAPTDVPILAAHDGVVLFAGGDPCCGYGYYIILVGPSGITTLYAHLDAFIAGTGDIVRQGQPLGIVGCTGRCTGPHVHFEVLRGEDRWDPLDFLP